MKLPRQDERIKQAATAAAILFLIACGVIALWIGSLHLPGPPGEFLRMIVGIMSTPFFLEASFVITGALVVMVVNAISRHREGDDFVSPDDLAQRENPRSRPKHP